MRKAPKPHSHRMIAPGQCPHPILPHRHMTPPISTNLETEPYLEPHQTSHCAKSARTRSYPGPHFSAPGLNPQRYEVSPHISANAENTDQNKACRINPNTDTFHVVPMIEHSCQND